VDEAEKQKLIADYLSKSPNVENSKAIVAELAQTHGLKEASIRHHLVKAGVYIKAVKWRVWDIKADEAQVMRDKFLLFGTTENRHEILEEFSNKFFIRADGIQTWAESNGVWPLTTEEQEEKKAREDEYERAWKASPAYKQNQAQWAKLERQQQEVTKRTKQITAEYKQKENLATLGGCFFLIVLGVLMWVSIFGGDSRSLEEKGIEEYCTRQGLSCPRDLLRQ
jgi:hypothetical protein